MYPGERPKAVYICSAVALTPTTPTLIFWGRRTETGGCIFVCNGIQQTEGWSCAQEGFAETDVVKRGIHTKKTKLTKRDVCFQKTDIGKENQNICCIAGIFREKCKGKCM